MPYAVATFVPPSTPCNGEEYDQRFLLQSQPGDVPTTQFNSQYVMKTGSASAAANGVVGTRDTFHYVQDTGFPPPQGTDLVRYTFVTGGRTYVVEYLHYPTEPDRTSDYNLLVTKTLRFA